MKRKCEVCQVAYDDAERSTVCPHERIAPPEVLARKDAAFKLMGKHIRFAHQPDLPENVCQVQSINFEGMVRIDKFPGEFAPHLFVESIY